MFSANYFVQQLEPVSAQPFVIGLFKINLCLHLHNTTNPAREGWILQLNFSHQFDDFPRVVSPLAAAAVVAAVEPIDDRCGVVAEAEIAVVHRRKLVADL